MLLLGHHRCFTSARSSKLHTPKQPELPVICHHQQCDSTRAGLDAESREARLHYSYILLCLAWISRSELFLSSCWSSTRHTCNALAELMLLIACSHALCDER